MCEKEASEASAPQSRSATPESADSIRLSKASISTHSETHLDYEPIPLRWPTLSALFFIICSLVAMLEYAHKLLPAINDPTAANIPHVVELNRRTMLIPSDPMYCESKCVKA